MYTCVYVCTSVCVYMYIHVICFNSHKYIYMHQVTKGTRTALPHTVADSPWGILSLVVVCSLFVVGDGLVSTTEGQEKREGKSKQS